MTLADVAAGTTVFVDANILVFALTNHPTYGAACDVFLDRVENQHRRLHCAPAAVILFRHRPLGPATTVGKVGLTGR
jgi:hypothetical protein